MPQRSGRGGPVSQDQASPGGAHLTPGRRRRKAVLALTTAAITVAATGVTLLSIRASCPAQARPVRDHRRHLVQRRQRQQRQVRRRRQPRPPPTAPSCSSTAATAPPPRNGNCRPPAAATTRSTTTTMPSRGWDVTNVSTADSALIQLWSYSSGNNQQWQPVANADGSYHFVNRNSGKCLDTPGASTRGQRPVGAVRPATAPRAQNFDLTPSAAAPPRPRRRTRRTSAPTSRCSRPRCPRRASRAP